MSERKNEYQGYVHTNGSVQVKRYIPELGLTIERCSPFVERYIGIVEAENYDEAKKILKEKADE